MPQSWVKMMHEGQDWTGRGAKNKKKKKMKDKESHLAKKKG